MQDYICQTCGYVYDPAVEDSATGVEAGIPFEALSDDWQCPKCKSPKTSFEPEDAPAMEVPLAE